MNWRLCMLLIALLLPLGVGTEPALAVGAPVAHCSPAPEDCSGWYRSDVTATWTWDAGGQPQTCVFKTISTTQPASP